ncbi:DNA-binding transcriptional regulator, AcrR family [Ruania alba]|uniref:DNA-binding transcriptional regulator, AcrR family n=1 Tax=Ruania alba TaxID=648782 RepID=A0A1H5KDS9_9MICO|nr:DNA-binding transcriptional regulator, AcrR family [Ruania alba]
MPTPPAPENRDATDEPPAPTDGRSRRWDSHRAERRRALARAARRAIHHEGPDLSMDELATAMETSKSIVYRYFTDKAGLQAAVGELVLEEMSDGFEAAAHTDGDPHARLRAMVGVYTSMIVRSPHVYRFVTRTEGADVPDLSGFQTTITRYVETPLREALDDSDASSRLVAGWAAGVVGFVRGVGDVWLGADPGTNPSAETMADLVTDWLWYGAGAATPTPSREHT